MAAVLSAEEVLRVRMRALRLGAASSATPAVPSPPADVAAGAASASAVVSHMFGLQGQDWRSSKWAVGVRAPGIAAADVVAAMNAGMIVRSWPMRGTVHLVAAEDIGWMQQLTNARVLAGAPKRRAFLGMSDAVLERATEVSLAALAGGNSLDRTEIAQVWTDAGIDWKPNWRYHLIWWLCQNGLTTFGPVPAASGAKSDPEPRLVLASEWIPSPRDLTGDEALCEFAARYVRGRGAVSRKDLASWAQLPAAAVSRALELAAEAGLVVAATRAGIPGAAGALWADPAALDTTDHGPATETSSGWQLLPAFDEHLLGYSDRSPQFAAEHLEHLVPGKNGVFLATVVHDGRTVGTWRRDPKSRAVTASPFPGERLDAAALAPELRRWAAFYGEPEPELAAGASEV
ncbi:winged helix DNA-binding domain-containing protein [Leucobacter komagatae]|uniref:Winged helix DNA-binding protein n=1 Tax=Leucobacter komagatae TaxID=55969 RepID=A0A0D0HZY8_9MICO|nr:winged helix DNA-binding domain-containing protein [Leucobacter komagatae]KIP53136.1 hypothetical protein SD72_04685 [Leucobacter komagatae]